MGGKNLGINYARELLKLPNKLLKEKFELIQEKNKFYDTVFSDISYENIVAIGPLESEVPAMKELYKDSDLADFFCNLDVNNSYLVKLDKKENTVQISSNENGEISKLDVDANITNKILEIDFRNL